jgi:hypothetical protein
MSVYNISTETPNDKVIFNSSANILTDSPYRQNRLSVINSSSNNINGQSPKNGSIVNLVQQSGDLIKKNLDENLLKYKAIKTYQTAEPNHLSFDLNDSIVITNNSSKDLWVISLLIEINFYYSLIF